MDVIMIVNDITLKELKPSKNMRLTNGTDIAEGSVFLGVGDSVDNWYEITEEKAERIQAERDSVNELLSVDS